MKRILAVDDDPKILEALSAALATKRYEVVTINNSDAALKLIQEQPFDLVLLDLFMPGKNGFDLYREFAPTQNIPVLFVSGYSQSFSPSSSGFRELWTEQFSLGQTDILYKPFRLASLFEKVEALIGTAEVAANGNR